MEAKAILFRCYWADSVSCYYEHSRALPFGILSIVYYCVHCGFMRWCRLAYVRGKVFSALSDVRSNLLDVKGCLKFFGAVFRGVFAWTFSMLSALEFLVVVSPDYGHYLFGIVDGVDYLD